MNSSVLSALPVGHGDDASMGMLLRHAGKLSVDDAERVLLAQQELGLRFGETAVRLGLVSEADVTQALARQFAYPYLAKGEADLSPALVAAYEPFSAPAEALRAVRSQLMLRWFARGRRALAVAGASPDDGASHFTANLALVFSQLGEQTLLVDANLREPRQHGLFGVKSRQGLSDLLAGRTGLDVISRVTGFPDLSLLPAGTLPPNPQELLARDGLRALHAQLVSHYDVVLYDLPPYSAGADALAVAAQAGGVLLVAGRHRALIADVSRMAAQMVEAGADVVGSVVVED
jgi:protein-tyrosine kinase